MPVPCFAGGGGGAPKEGAPVFLAGVAKSGFASYASGMWILIVVAIVFLLALGYAIGWGHRGGQP